MTAVMDAAAFTVAALFDPNQAALDVFGDKTTSDARRRCQPTTPEETTLFDLHRNVALAYALAYGGLSGERASEQVVVTIITTSTAT